MKFDVVEFLKKHKIEEGFFKQVTFKQLYKAANLCYSQGFVDGRVEIDGSFYRWHVIGCGYIRIEISLFESLTYLKQQEVLRREVLAISKTSRVSYERSKRG